MTFVHCKFKACLMNTIEGCSLVGNEVVGIIGDDTDVVHILSTLIRFQKFVEVFPHKARKPIKCPALALCPTFTCKMKTSEVECEHLYWPLVGHLKPVRCLSTVQFADTLLSAMCWAASARVLTGWLLIKNRPNLVCWFFSDLLITGVSFYFFSALFLG